MRTPVIGLARWRVFLAFGVDVVCQFVRWNKWSTKTNSINRSAKMLGDLGGAFSVPMVRMGDRLGLYKALEKRPMTSKEWRRKPT